MKEQQTATINLPAINKLTCKTIYKLLVDNQNLAPPTSEKRLKECGFDTPERQKIYPLALFTTKEVKLELVSGSLSESLFITSRLKVRYLPLIEAYLP